MLGLHEATAKGHRNRTRTKDRPKPGFIGDRINLRAIVV